MPFWSANERFRTDDGTDGYFEHVLRVLRLLLGVFGLTFGWRKEGNVWTLAARKVKA
jgi:hypothetical protein